MVRTTLSLSVATALLLSTSIAFAQDSAAQDSAAETETYLEEVTVTARKREETLQDIPISVAARTENQMRQSGLRSLEDISQTVASFSVQNLGPGQSVVAIRGSSAGKQDRDLPGIKEQVGVYLDESVISLSLFTPDLDLFDLNRVEVLRGPQGTLFGSGSLSGTVRYITNQPDTGSSYGAVELDANTVDGGSSGGYGKAFVNAPLGESTALRVAAYYTKLPGFIDAHQPDGSIKKDVNDGERYGGRIALRFEPSDQLSITPRLVYQKVEVDGYNREDLYNILGNEYTTTRPNVDFGKNEQYTQFDEVFTDEFTLVDLDITYDFSNDMTLTSITSYTDRSIVAGRDAGALTSSITGGSIGLGEEVYTLDSPLDDATDVSGWTQELRLGGGNDSLAWVVGVFYSDFERDYGQELLVSGFTELTGIPTEGDYIAPEDGLFWSQLQYDFKQLAIFGEATWSVTDRFDLTGGLRYYDFDEERIQTFDGIFADPGTTAGGAKADGFAPRLIADFAVNDNVSINGQISKGFRLGGLNDPLNLPLCTPEDASTFGGFDSFGDEKLWNYEAGVKSVLMGGRATFNAAIFYQDIKDLQAVLLAGTCSSRIVYNVPKAHSAGIEFEFAAQQTDRFDWALSASYINAELDSSVTSIAPDGSVSILAGLEDGNRLPSVPEFQGAAAATYVIPMDNNWETYIHGIVQYVGDRVTQFGDYTEGFGNVNMLSFEQGGGGTIGGPLTQCCFTFDYELPSYTTANARIGVRNYKWDVAFYVNNFTNEQAYLALDQERGTLARVGFLVNQPRTYGITLRVGFE
ncbi:TonB-dependent receptor [Pseudomonadota bacterium]